MGIFTVIKKTDNGGEGMEERTFPRGTLRICLDEYKNGTISGRIYTKFRKEPSEFANLGEILMKGEEIFDMAGYPMAFQQRRTFSNKLEEKRRKGRPVTCVLCDRELGEQKGRLKTLDVVVNSRRHSSWQGVLLGSDGNLIGNFVSELELLKMLVRIFIELDTYLC